MYNYLGYCKKCGCYATICSETNLCNLCLNCINNQIYYNPIPSFNYECPDCKGRFNSPAVPAVTSSIIYKCPFCAKPMEGL